MQPSFSRKQLWQLIAIVTLFTSSAVHAAYVVMDDDLMPTRSIIAQSQPTHYTILFAKERSQLTQSARTSLDMIIPQMRGQSVHIIGRPDANVYEGGKLAQLASNRALVMRKHLMSAGIPANAITIEIDNTPNPQPNGSLYPSDIAISRAADNTYNHPAPTYSAPAQSYAPAATDPIQPRPQPAQRTTAPADQTTTITAADKAARSQIIQFANRAAQSGNMDPIAALKLIQLLSNAGNETASQPTNAAPTNQPIASISITAPAAIQSPFVATTNTARKLTWPLETTKTLRDNIDAWAKQAGWNATQWFAANYYQVTVASTLEGEFPDVLRQIADSTKLNICIYQRSKLIKVTDANISCKD